MKTLKDRLTHLQNGLTQRDFAAKIGVPLNTYTAWLRDERLPSYEAIQKICTALGVSADWLLTGSGEPPRKDSPVTPPSNNICHYPNGCDIEAELADMRTQIAKMAAQLETVTLLLGASLHLDDKQKYDRQAG